MIQDRELLGMSDTETRRREKPLAAKSGREEE